MSSSILAAVDWPGAVSACAEGEAEVVRRLRVSFQDATVESRRLSLSPYAASQTTATGTAAGLDPAGSRGRRDSLPLLDIAPFSARGRKTPGRSLRALA